MIKTFLIVLDKHAPIKKKIFKGESCQFVTKQLRKATMNILRNVFFKDRNDASQSSYRKQRNLPFCEKPKKSISRIWDQNL